MKVELIAGVALARGMCLVTSNIAEFEGMEELQIESWVHTWKNSAIDELPKVL